MHRWIMWGLGAAIVLVGCSDAPVEEEEVVQKRYVKIGTGAQTGVYYAAGLAVAEFVNEGTDVHGIDAAVESTDGSVFNLNAVMQGELDFGFVQADRQFQAAEGKRQWKDNPQSDLRYICSFHAEMVTLVAAEDSGINNLQQLKGKTVSLGSYGSGTRGNADTILSQIGLIPERDFNAEDLTASEASMMLQDGRIDAFFYTVGHPNGVVTEATNGRRRVRLVPLLGLDEMIYAKPYYSKMKIPINHYPRALNRDDVPTLGMRTTLVAHKDADDEMVYQVTKAIFSNLARLNQRHPSFSSLTVDQMLEAQFAPIHHGALRYYREVGYL